ncbi:MAG: hypothetical protein DRG82_04130 [Deltaproteobacteria bacterium]|nr:MAG: hypothetical protein DRG82_04130 [Deltaproteobacteria bacterium]
MKSLIDLQACDTEMGNLQSRIAKGPMKIKELENQLVDMDSEYEAAETQLEDLRRLRREIDSDIEAINGKIDKANTKLSNIKSNKEYKAALKEIDDLTREKSKLEDKAIELMEQVDALSEQCRVKKEERERVYEEINQEKERIVQEMNAMDKAIQSLSRKRGKFCKKVSDDLLRKYDFIRERKAGLALTPVFNGVCQACHMEIPPQRYNELIRGEKLLDCPNCHRIIYWGDNEQFRKNSPKK